MTELMSTDVVTVSTVSTELVESDVLAPQEDVQPQETAVVVPEGRQDGHTADSRYVAVGRCGVKATRKATQVLDGEEVFGIDVRSTKVDSKGNPKPNAGKGEIWGFHGRAHATRIRDSINAGTCAASWLAIGARDAKLTKATRV